MQTQASAESTVYDHATHQIHITQPHPGSPMQQQHHHSYLSSSPHVQQPLPASSMASSVAALQRLSASIDVTSHDVTASNRDVTSRCNSRTSAYEDASDKSDPVRGHSDIPSADSAVAEDLALARPQYLTANCVVYSFYHGDLENAIEDHFNRALKRGANNEDRADNSRASPKHSEREKLQSGKKLFNV